MYNAGEKRKLKYATDPEYRQRERERVAKAKSKKQFIEWQRNYNREYYHNTRKDKLREKNNKARKAVSKLKADSQPAKEQQKNRTVSEDQRDVDDPIAYEVEFEEDDNDDATQNESNVAVPDREPTFHGQASRVTERRIRKQVDLCAMLEIQVEYKCKRCSQRFLTLDESIDHVKTKHAMGFECGKCSAEFSELRQLMQHMSKVHPLTRGSPVKTSVIKSVAKEAVKLSGTTKKGRLPEEDLPKVPETYIAKKQKAAIAQTQKPVEKVQTVEVQLIEVDEPEEPVAKKKRGRPPKLIKTPPKIVNEGTPRKRGRPKKIIDEEQEVVDLDAEEEDEVEEVEEQENESQALNRVTRQAARAQTRKLLEETINEALEDFEEEGEPVTESRVADGPVVNSGQIFYSCTVCSVSFLEEKYYQQHMDAHLVVILN